MGTEPNGHGTPSTATAPSRVNTSIGNNATHSHGAVSCKRTLKVAIYDRLTGHLAEYIVHSLMYRRYSDSLHNPVCALLIRTLWISTSLHWAAFILAILLASCDRFVIKWVLDPNEKSIAKLSQDLKNLLKIASINGA